MKKNGSHPKVITKLAKWESLHSKDDMRNEESIFFGNQNMYYGCEIWFLKFSYDEGKNPLQISYYMQCIISHTLCTLELKKGRHLRCKEGNESRRVTGVKEEKQPDMSRGHNREHSRETELEQSKTMHGW